MLLAGGAAVVRRVNKQQVDGISPDDHLFSLEVSSYFLLNFRNYVTPFAIFEGIILLFLC